MPDEDGHGKYFPMIKRLSLTELHQLACIWNKDPTGIFVLENLQIMHIKSCSSLKYLFTPSATRKLHQLNELKLEECEMLETIIDNGDIKTVEFPTLSRVELKSLTRLIGFYSHHVEFPKLKTLMIEKCPMLEEFTTKFANIDALFSTKRESFTELNEIMIDSCDKLKEICIINKDLQELWHYNCPPKSFCKLEILTLSNNKLLSSISSSMIIRFKNLKKLTLDKCELLIEVFNLEDDKPDYNIQEILPQLKALTLSSLSKLTCLWNKEPQVPFFSNLVSIYIAHCGILKSLFSLSSVKSLGKLKLLKLHNCEKIEEVISNEKYENVFISFPLMECLVLKDLPKLVNFCQQNGTFNWPNLQMVRVRSIPCMETFSRGNLNTPLLRSVHITFTKKLWLGNLNKTISYMHNNPGM
uniref:Disease resistance protein RPS2 n=1 Tax=Cajanus cajan TaxID=3821 RepID=A0A151SIK1_CAJCA|nr:Disease resistance protein RPS2 [Cajanus cajan]